MSERFEGARLQSRQKDRTKNRASAPEGDSSHARSLGHSISPSPSRRVPHLSASFAERWGNENLDKRTAVGSEIRRPSFMFRIGRMGQPNHLETHPKGEPRAARTGYTRRNIARTARVEDEQKRSTLSAKPGSSFFLTIPVVVRIRRPSSEPKEISRSLALDAEPILDQQFKTRDLVLVQLATMSDDISDLVELRQD